MAKHVVAAVADIPPGGRKLVEVSGRAVVVFNVGGEFFALNNRCPHRNDSEESEADKERTFRQQM